MASSAGSALCFADFATRCAVPSTAGNLADNMQVDVFSFGVVTYELLIRQVTSAVVSQSGDVNMPQMYANKVSASARCFFWLTYLDKSQHTKAETYHERDSTTCCHCLGHPALLLYACAKSIKEWASNCRGCNACYKSYHHRVPVIMLAVPLDCISHGCCGH